MFLRKVLSQFFFIAKCSFHLPSIYSKKKKNLFLLTDPFNGSSNSLYGIKDYTSHIMTSLWFGSSLPSLQSSENNSKLLPAPEYAKLSTKILQ